MLLTGKSTICMVIFNSYVKLPEGILYIIPYIILLYYPILYYQTNIPPEETSGPSSQMGQAAMWHPAPFALMRTPGALAQLGTGTPVMGMCGMNVGDESHQIPPKKRGFWVNIWGFSWPRWFFSFLMLNWTKETGDGLSPKWVWIKF